MSDYRESCSTSVAASIDECFAVLLDFAAYPQWSGPVQECRVLERHPDGLPRRVAFTVDMKLKTVRYTLEYAYDPPRTAHWRLVEGDLKGVEGSYVFEKAEGGKTRATCTQAVDVGFWMPGFVRRTLEQKALRDSVEEFRLAAEACARGRRRAPRA